MMRQTPLQNRVDPWGNLHTTSARGSLMGNRGILHNQEKRIVRPWAHKAWIACVLSYGNVRRSVFSPGTYSELFFLDEATALAAGHRPCGQCQRERYLLFKEYWAKANSQRGSRLTVKEIDKQLHAERTRSGKGKQTFQTVLGELPCGTMFEFNSQAYLVWKEKFLPWSFDGYATPIDFDSTLQVQVLTPRSIVEIYRLGFDPNVHVSAELYLQQ